MRRTHVDDRHVRLLAGREAAHLVVQVPGACRAEGGQLSMSRWFSSTDSAASPRLTGPAPTRERSAATHDDRIAARALAP
jgi:hypothetical protein